MCIGGIQDDEFGPLVWDSELEEWVARVRLGGDAAIELRIERPADEESANAISLESRAGFARLHQTESGIRARIAVEYARHYAEWHDDTITQAEMHARLRLNSVRILADGSAERADCASWTGWRSKARRDVWLSRDVMWGAGRFFVRLVVASLKSSVFCLRRGICTFFSGICN